MAYIPCNYGSSGGTLSETTLWTNPSPTSNFAAQTVNLSDNIKNYSYIEVEYKMSKSSTVFSKLLMPVSIFTQNLSTDNPMIWLSRGRNDGTGGMVRCARYASDTSVYISTTTGIGAGTTDNQYCIPTYIYGCK